jgi:hypothetical protein
VITDDCLLREQAGGNVRAEPRDYDILPDVVEKLDSL